MRKHEINEVLNTHCEECKKITPHYYDKEETLVCIYCGLISKENEKEKVLFT